MDEHSTKSKKKSHDKSANELEKYWQVVRDNSADFPGWTYLLHHIEDEKNIDAAREAFRSFFCHYPYCYGYWKKYADMEKLLCTAESAEKVFQEGVKAIPLSVDLWIHYINFYRDLQKDQSDSYEKIKTLFERALEAAGQEFRSDRLWDAYVTWQEENKQLREVTAIYDRLLSIPTQLYSHHFEKFCKHIKKHSPREILSTEEFLAIRQEVLTVSEDRTLDDEEMEKGDGEALPPGVENMEDAPPGIGSSNKVDKDMLTEDEIQLLRKKLVEKRKSLHEKNEIEVGKRWSFEDGIKRPYFHVKALERAQLKNWKDYLDFEVENGDHKRVVILFERCMIACALYEDMWLKYVRYMEEKDSSGAMNVYQRACDIHLPKKPAIHFAWAAYEEQRGNVEKSLEILKKLSECVPDLLDTTTRQINLERRRGNIQKVEELYSKAISEAKSVSMRSFFSIKFARYLFKIQDDVAKSKEILKNAIAQDSINPRLYMQLADIGYQRTPVDISTVSEALEMALASDMTEDQKIIFSQRLVEFLDDFGSDTQIIQKTYEEHLKRLRNYNMSARKRPAEENEEQEKSKKSKTEVNGVQPTSATAPVPTTVAPTTTADSSYQYSQSQWMGYGNNYNYGGWNFPGSYYGSH